MPDLCFSPLHACCPTVRPYLHQASPAHLIFQGVTWQCIMAHSMAVLGTPDAIDTHSIAAVSTPSYHRRFSSHSYEPGCADVYYADVAAPGGSLHVAAHTAAASITIDFSRRSHRCGACSSRQVELPALKTSVHRRLLVFTSRIAVF